MRFARRDYSRSVVAARLQKSSGAWAGAYSPEVFRPVTQPTSFNRSELRRGISGDLPQLVDSPQEITDGVPTDER
jgi:hypothetical protein